MNFAEQNLRAAFLKENCDKCDEFIESIKSEYKMEKKYGRSDIKIRALIYKRWAFQLLYAGYGKGKTFKFPKVALDFLRNVAKKNVKAEKKGNLDVPMDVFIDILINKKTINE